MSKKRVNQMNELLKRTIGKIILKDFDMPEDSLITVTRVETEANLIKSNVFINIIPQEKEDKVIESLKKYVYHIQQKVNQELKMRPVPKIIFQKDKKVEEATKVERILTEIKK